MVLVFTTAGLSAETQTFTMEEAVQFGLENNPEVQQYKLQREIADQQIRETRAAGLPQVSGSVTLENYPQRPVSLIPGEFLGEPETEFLEVSFGTDYDFIASATLDQLIF